jgi:hypothetical protein
VARADVAKPVELDATDLDELIVPDHLAEAAPQDATFADWWRNAAELIQPAPQPADVAPPPPPVWRTWLPWMIAAGIAFGVIRLVVGVWAVRSFRSCSTQVEDTELLRLVDEIAHQLAARSNPSVPNVLLTLRREESC